MQKLSPRTAIRSFTIACIVIIACVATTLLDGTAHHSTEPIEAANVAIDKGDESHAMPMIPTLSPVVPLGGDENHGGFERLYVDFDLLGSFEDQTIGPEPLLEMTYVQPNTHAVPEPSGLPFMACLLLGSVATRRRRDTSRGAINQPRSGDTTSAGGVSHR